MRRRKPRNSLGAVARVALGEDLAAGDLEGRVERGGAVAAVVVGAALGKARAQGQDRLGAIEGLDLGLLVHAQDQGPLGRVEVEADRCRSPWPRRARPGAAGGTASGALACRSGRHGHGAGRPSPREPPRDRPGRGRRHPRDALGPGLRGGVRRGDDASTCCRRWSARSTCRAPLGAGLRAAVRAVPAGLSRGADLGAADVGARDPAAGGIRRPARAFRAGVTDRWGSDRWKRLARATGLGEAGPAGGGDRAVGAQAGTVQRTAISVPASISLTTRPAAGRIRSTSCGV